MVDDGSDDHTTGVAEAAGARVVRHRENRGKGEALRTGFRIALEERREATVTLDADGQHDPGEIPRLLARWRETGAELAVGTRDFSAMPLSRRLANTLGRTVLRWATGRDLPDNQSGFRVVGRRLMNSMLERAREPGFGFEVEMIAECHRRGWRIAWVPISTVYAGEASHISPVAHVARFLRLAWRIRRSRRQTPTG